jgi:hypothetical protein
MTFWKNAYFYNFEQLNNILYMWKKNLVFCFWKRRTRPSFLNLFHSTRTQSLLRSYYQRSIVYDTSGNSWVKFLNSVAKTISWRQKDLPSFICHEDKSYNKIIHGKIWSFVKFPFPRIRRGYSISFCLKWVISIMSIKISQLGMIWGGKWPRPVTRNQRTQVRAGPQLLYDFITVESWYC